MTNWPTWSPDAEVAHKQISKSHVPLFLPVADEEGAVIPPAQWHTAIAGACVVVKFALHHWLIGGRDSFPAEIDSVMILEVRETAEPATGRKSIVKHLNMLGSDSDNDEKEHHIGQLAGGKRKARDEDGQNNWEDGDEDAEGDDQNKGKGGRGKKARK